MEEFLHSHGIRRAAEKAARLAADQDLATPEDLDDAVQNLADLCTTKIELQGRLEHIGFNAVDAAKFAIAYANFLQPAVQPPGNNPAAVKPSKRMDPKISIIKESETMEEMDRKEDEFAIYKEQTGLSDKDAALDLYRSCETPLKQKLRTSAKFQGASVKTLMEEIRRLATPRLNVTIERQEFRMMKQENTEKALDFESRLRQKAKNCNFRCCTCRASCPDCHTNPHDDEITRMLISGMADSELQREMWAKEETDLDKVIKAMVASETATEQQEKANRVGAKSSFRKRKEQDKIPKPVQQPLPCSLRDGKCARCGGNKAAEVCRAFGKTCENCKKANHFKAVCRGPPARGRQVESDEDDQSSGVGQVLTVPIKTGWIRHNKSTTVSSLLWNPRKKTFVEKTTIDSKEDSLKVSIQTLHGIEVQTRGLRLAKSPITDSRITEHSVLPDTGAQINLAGRPLMRAMGILPQNLHKNNQRCMAVGNHPLDMLGFLPVMVSTLDTDGERRETRTVVYFADKVKTTLLSLSTLTDLGCISTHWPKPAGRSELVRSASIHDENIDADDDESPEETAGYSTRDPTPNRPEEMPFPATQENIPKLKKWLVEKFAKSTFNTSSAPLAKMTGPPMTIHVDKLAKPRAIHKPIPVPHHWQQKVKEDLLKDVKLGILEKVPMGVPTRWQARMVVVAKKSGLPRRTVDLKMLNDHCLRETHPTEAPFYQVSRVEEDSYKSVFDAWSGYHAVELDEESRNLTMFITPWGRFRYCRAPQGFLAAGDAYTRRADEICKNVENLSKVIDDSLIFDKTIKGNFYKSFDFLKLCGDNGITFNLEKFQFCERDVEFAGFRVTETGVKPSKEILDNIANYPAPTTLTDARSWFGLIEQVAWAYSISDTMINFRDLTKPSVKSWRWTEALQEEFEAAKLEILRRVEDGVRTFDVSKRTCLATDWSKLGLGFLVLQKHCNCPMDNAPRCCREGWVLVFAGSRRCTDAETRYAPICGEALGVAWSLTKARMFTLGCKDLLVTTDHNPLVSILGNRSLEDIPNPRLLRLKEKTLRFRFEIKYCPGKMNHGPDAFSRAHSKVGSIRVFDTEGEDDEDDTHTEELAAVVNACILDGGDSALVAALDDAVIDMTEVAMECAQDQEFQAVRASILEGFPEERLCRPIVLPFLKDQARLSIVSEGDLEVMMFTDSDANQRIFIPRSLRNRVKENLHAAHQRDLARVKLRANQHVYWPAMAADLRSFINQCRFCQINKPSQPKEPLILAEQPSYPFEKVAADYFLVGGIYYLVYVDRFSGWPEVAQFDKHHATATELVHALRKMFIAFGAPAELSCDNGTTLVSNHARKFFAAWKVQLRVSSTGYAQSNGRAECAVKMAKKLVTNNVDGRGRLDTDKFAKAILAYRNSAIYPELGRTIAQTLLGRHLRDTLPAPKTFYELDKRFLLDRQEREDGLAKRHARMKTSYNRGSKELTPLMIGDVVRVQNQTTVRGTRWDRTGIIVETLPYRKYRVKINGGGRTTVRNRRFLCKIPAGNPTEGTPRLKAPDHQVVNDHVTFNSDESEDEETEGPSAIRGPTTQGPPAIRGPTAPATQGPMAAPPAAPPTLNGTPPRRSSRPKAAFQPFQAQMRGKSHGGGGEGGWRGHV